MTLGWINVIATKTAQFAESDLTLTLQLCGETMAKTSRRVFGAMQRLEPFLKEQASNL